MTDREKAIGWHIVKADNLRFVDAERTKIDCEADFSHVKDGPFGFTADKNDVEPHGREIFAELISGDYGPIAEYVAPPPVLVGSFKFRKMLNKSGLREAVEAYVKKSSQDVQDEWQLSIVLQRSGPFVLALQKALKKTDKEMDDLFRSAISL